MVVSGMLGPLYLLWFLVIQNDCHIASLMVLYNTVNLEGNHYYGENMHSDTCIAITYFVISLFP